MKLYSTLKNDILYKLGFVPIISNYIFLDADDIFHKLRDAGFPQKIRNMRPSERRVLHFSFGMMIRNSFLLWHPKNPYTMKKLAELSEERQADSQFHPDNLSWSVISRLIVAAGITESQTSSDFDTSESLLYSLMARLDDKPETLEAIRVAVADLVANERWDLLDEVFAETILYAPSPVKLKTLLNGVEGNTEKLTPVNYMRVAERAVSYGVEFKRDDSVSVFR